MASDEPALGPAKALIAERRFAEGLGVLGQLEKREPLTAQGHCLVAQCHVALKDPGRAFEAARRATSTDPTYGPGHRLVSAAALLLDDTQTARAAAEEAVRLAPNVVEGHIALCRAALAGRDTKTAAKAASEACSLAPEQPAGHLAMGLVAVQQRRPRNAEQHFRDALACDPDNATALDSLRASLQMQDPKHMTNVLRVASRRASRHPRAHEHASRLAGMPPALLGVVLIATLILLSRAGESLAEAAAATCAIVLLVVLVVLRLRYRATGLPAGGAGPQHVRLLWFLGSSGVIVSLLFASYFAVTGLSDLFGASSHSQWDVVLLANAAALLWLAASLARLVRRVGDRMRA